MTQEEFLEDLKKYASQTQWNLYRGGELRTLNGVHCPVSFVAWKKLDSKYGYRKPMSAGELLGMGEGDISDIIIASDYKLGGLGTQNCKELRKKLFEITKPLQTVDI